MDVKIREADESDSSFLFALRNDPIVRANSFHHEEVPRGDHERWFSSVMASDRRRQFIITADGAPAGQLRLDLDDTGACAEISYSIAPTMRGRGIGNRCIALSEEITRRYFPSVRTLIAEVLPHNGASAAIFVKNGFRESAREASKIVYEKEIKKTTV